MVSYLIDHLGDLLPSPALFAKSGERFRAEVKALAEVYDIPVICFVKRDCKIEVVRPLLTKVDRVQRCGVVAIGVAQEFQNVSIVPVAPHSHGPRLTCRLQRVRRIPERPSSLLDRCLSV